MGEIGAGGHCGAFGGRCEHGVRGMGSGEVLGGEGGRARGAGAAGLGWRGG